MTSELRRARAIEIVFRQGKVFGREGQREWAIAEVGGDELLWAPDGARFAYVRQVRGSYRVVVRNLRGDSINEFPPYRPGRPTDLDWIDDQHLSYLAPLEGRGTRAIYVVHAVATGEITRVLRGDSFVWSPGRKHLAYVSGPGKRQEIKVGTQRVWPRGAALKAVKISPRRILSDLVWSPDGNSLAFMERVGQGERLVVILVLDNEQGDLIWSLPAGAHRRGHKLFWAQNRVVVGESLFKPRFAATWSRAQ